MADKTKNNRRLGRGLSSLIVNSSKDLDSQESMQYQPVDQTERPAGVGEHHIRISMDTPSDTFQDIQTEDIATNPYQPRREFDEESLLQLAESVKNQGLLQPLIVAASSDGEEKPFVLVAGERRLRAARLAGLESVRCVIRRASRQQMLEWALVENIQREDLNPVEKARAYSEYISKFNLSQAEAAERLSQPRSTIANYLRLLDLCDEAQALIVEGKLSLGHGKVLASLAGDAEQQKALAIQAAGRELSVRQLEQLVEALESQSTQGKTKRQRKPKPPFIMDLEERITQSIGTKVSICPSRAKHTGRIIINYYSLDDFDRIAEKLGVNHDID